MSLALNRASRQTTYQLTLTENQQNECGQHDDNGGCHLGVEDRVFKIAEDGDPNLCRAPLALSVMSSGQ